MGIAALPTPRLIDPTGYEPGFLAVYADAPQVDLLRVHVEGRPNQSAAGLSDGAAELRRAHVEPRGQRADRR